MSHRRLAVAASLLALAVLTGCSSQPAAPASTSTPAAATSEPTVTATPTTVPTASVDPSEYTCETILSPTTLSVFVSKESSGFTLQADFEQRTRDFGGDLVYFADYGGILCQWAYPSGAEPVDYGFSPITPAETTERLAQLTDGGFVTSTHERGTLVTNADVASFPDTYLFMDGYWLYASDRDVLDLIVDNLPAGL
jgi:hypothetical protein